MSTLNAIGLMLSHIL